MAALIDVLAIETLAIFIQDNTRKRTVPEFFDTTNPKVLTAMNTSNDTGNSQTITATFGADNFEFHRITFTDKVILNVMVNGAMDTSFDIPLLTLSTINRSLDQEDSLGPEPVVLMGDPNNLKLQVIASQIGKVAAQLKEPRNVILSIASRWFGNPDETNYGDFDKLVFVLQQIKSLLA